MRILLTLCLLCGLSSLEATTLPACTPSRACALDRAKRLVLEQLSPHPTSRHSAGASAAGAATADAVRVLSSLMLRDPRDYRSGFTRAALQKVAAADQQTLLGDLARQLIERRRDVSALEVIVDIADVARRDALYLDMALDHLRARRFDLAYWAADRMQAGVERNRALLSVADAQLRADQAVAAGQTAGIVMESTPERSPTRDAILQIQAKATAQLGDARRALEVVDQIRQPELIAETLKSIVDLQIERKARTEALATVRVHREQVRRGRSTRSAELDIAEQLSLLGANREALEMVRGSELDQARTLAAIAMGAARDERFAEALATLEKIPAEQRAAVRNAAARVAQLRVLGGVDFLTAFGAVGAFSPLSPKERSALVLSTAQLLVQRGNLPGARDGLNYEVENAQQDPECETGADCARVSAPRSPASKCSFGPRDESLCNASLLQAQLGFIEDADRTANVLRSEQALITVLLAIAQGQITAGRPALARRSFTRALLLARLEPNLSYFDGTLEAYANWVAITREHHDALGEILAATRELARLDSNAGCRADGALLAVTAAHASAGQFATAFTLTETLVQCQPVSAYLRIYERGRQ